MKLSCLFSLVAVSSMVAFAAPGSVEDRIVARAKKDGIDLSVLDVTGRALASIANTYRDTNAMPNQGSKKRNAQPLLQRGPGSIFDIHAHSEPDWYRSISPYSGGDGSPATGGSLTPVWNITYHLDFMNALGISHSVLGFTGPSANVYMHDKPRTIALARLINEQLAAYTRQHPDSFSFFASIPLPYAREAAVEAEYAIKELGAVGVALLSNHEGIYLGNEGFTEFWRRLEGLGGRQIVYVHPSTPYMKVDDTLVVVNPLSSLDTSRMEFYMETARTFMDMTLTQTLHNFTNLHFVLPHVGGAFPVMIDRVLKTVHQELYDSSLAIYRSRFWWDSASPTYFHQVSGLLGYDIPKSQLLYGTDFPFIRTDTNKEDLQAIMSSNLLTPSEKDDMLSTNYKSLFGDKLHL